MRQVYPNQTYTKLVLIDHDGTLCQTNENAYDSIKYAAKETAQLYNINLSNFDDNQWSIIFHETKGTTERYLARYLCFKFSLPLSKFDDFTTHFYQARANWYSNMKSYQEYIYDTYYPDSESLVYRAAQDSTTLVALVTGNPISTIKERLSLPMSKIFLNSNTPNTFGDEADSRQELIHLSIKKAKKLNFTPQKDKTGFYTNVYYIGDSRSDFFSGLKSKTRTVWIPNRMLQTVKDIMAEDSLAFILDYFSDTVKITNNLEHPDIAQFLDL